MGGAQAIVATVGKADVLSRVMNGLAPRGRLVVLGAGKHPMTVSTGPLVTNERGVFGSITGSPFSNEKALDFAVLAGIRPRIETLPLEDAYKAYRRMRSGEVKFRAVLTMSSSDRRTDA